MFNWLRNIFGSPAHSNNVMINDSMKHIHEAVSNHLAMKTTGALLLTGDWGSGKTYYIKNILFPKIEADTGIKSIIVSLYGVTDKNSIANKVLFAYLDKVGKNNPLSVATLAKGAHNALESFTWLKKFVDVNKLFVGSGEDLFRLLPKEGLLICFDDLERLSDKINTEDFLGMVNELVENKGNKVLIIANEGLIDGGIKFKEKTIEKTIHFTNDLSSIFDSITTSYDDIDFKNYLNQNKNYIIASLNPVQEDEEEEKKLSVLFANIRTLKFAIEHFHYVFKLLSKTKNISDALIQKQFKDIWLFTLAISIEFKKPGSISFKDKKNLDAPYNPLTNDQLGNLIWAMGDDEEENQPDSHFTYRDKFVKTYYTRLEEQYLYFEQVFNLITAGKAIEEASFLTELEEIYKIKDGVVNPADELLSKFLHNGYWNFEDHEFKPALKELLSHAENGEFLDLLSYLNAGVYLLRFNEILDESKDVIKEKLKIGIIKTLEKLKTSILANTQLDMITGNFQEENLKSLVVFIKEQLIIKEASDSIKEVQRMEDLFVNNLSGFVKELLPTSTHIRTPDPLLFDKVKIEIINGAIAQWKPNEIMELSSLFQIRYLDPSYADRLTDEIPFLEALQQNLNDFDDSKRPLSLDLIKNQLIPKIAECIKTLNVYKAKIAEESRGAN
ncbi:hypothetical protein [Pedobacter sp. MR22-3]|uniref:hypothetical protein n=1 Tax=Pedobacter sp. MR22-3 TaxID=2994552 RepID=UPI00224571D8|nr:hypothetical protein [Pedobacter sp. MR22-3]MCX2585949.1 hypothetical protein [Pedobacter sp. MR22-3]